MLELDLFEVECVSGAGILGTIAKEAAKGVVSGAAWDAVKSGAGWVYNNWPDRWTCTPEEMVWMA